LGSVTYMSNLEQHLEMDESLWRMWREDGVTEHTPLAVDVSFYATRKESADQIAEGLRCWGLSKVQVRSTRTIWILKGWQITGVDEGTWSLQKLQDRSKRYVRLAEIWNATYEGCGALIDPAKINPPNPQGGANGGQPPEPEHTSTSVAAAPHRSP
jgi:hypothetical protein